MQPERPAGQLPLRGRFDREFAPEIRATPLTNRYRTPGRVPGRLVERRGVAERRRVEDDEVGEGALADDAAIGQAEDLGRPARSTSGSPARA